MGQPVFSEASLGKDFKKLMIFMEFYMKVYAFWGNGGGGGIIGGNLY